MTVGQRLKTARIAANMSRNEVAKHLNCSIHTIKSWELDRHRPKPIIMARIEVLFGLEKGHLTCSKDVDYTTALSNLGRAISRLPPKKQHHAVTIIEHFSKLISDR
ncbi:helix-turn-helix domain-containing protein [Marinomonas shanghaiensis]|uniref:helix-turn-helix domain-containing protein n=1 Tax=Marinomonas shanghaiensis TaxID=2202418 RepID=UPI000DB93702|nr:helix-turn-helix transcriptional regulator [Marinomonas shanghaiensis]